MNLDSEYTKTDHGADGLKGNREFDDESKENEAMIKTDVKTAMGNAHGAEFSWYTHEAPISLATPRVRSDQTRPPMRVRPSRMMTIAPLSARVRAADTPAMPERWNKEEDTEDNE